MRFVGGATPAERIYDIDADLRPEGRQGPLARSLEAYRSYWESYAAGVGAPGHAAGPAGRRRPRRRASGCSTELAPRVVGRRPRAEDAREIRRMKARIERERIPAGEDPPFHLKLGRGSLSDIEFTAQLLQLRHGVRGDRHRSRRSTRLRGRRTPSAADDADCSPRPTGSASGPGTAGSS